jgi:hypothetical protein
MIVGSVVAAGFTVLIRILANSCPGSGGFLSSGEAEMAKPLTTIAPCGSSSSGITCHPGDAPGFSPTLPPPEQKAETSSASSASSEPLLFNGLLLTIAPPRIVSGIVSHRQRIVSGLCG